MPHALHTTTEPAEYTVPAFDLGPERPTQPPEVHGLDEIADALRARARQTILREACHLDFWMGLFDATECPDVDLTAIATALHAAHSGFESVAHDTLAQAVASTLDSLIAAEAAELLREEGIECCE